jgi:DNA-binding NarL/FixJ family response regulator
LRAAVAKVPAAGAGARLEDLLEPARRRLGEGATAGLLAEGRAMTADQAIRYAMSADRADRADQPAPGADLRPTLAASNGSPGASAPSALTPREWEIAAMIARGLTNQQIADELVISRATVARHVANILTKLGFSSRAQVAAWMAGRDPGPSD